MADRTKLTQKETESEKLAAEVKELTQANAQFYDTATRFTTIFENAQSLTNERDMYEGNQLSLKRTIKIMKGKIAVLCLSHDADLDSAVNRT